MKKILILLIFCLPLLGRAQTQKSQLDKLVSREQVSTGILYNKVIPQAKLHTFGQNNQKDTSSHNHFMQAYYELYLSSYDNSKMYEFKQLRDWMRYKSEKNTLILGLLNFEFNYSEDLTEEKLNEVNSTPNLLKINKLSTFVGAILSEKPLIAGKSVQIELNENLIFGNYPQAIVSLLADFGEGKTHIFLKNGTYALHYATSGTKTIRLVGKFADGTEKTTYTRIEVQNDQSATARGSAVPPCYIRDGVNRIKSTIPFTPYVPELFATAPAEVELGYYYASNGTTSPCNSYRTLRKPILIIDGIDPQDKRKIIRDINNPDEPIIYDKLNYKDANGADGNLGEELRAQGYDVIVANFPSYRVGNLGSGPGPFAFPYYRDGGADYIERNAMGIIAVIQQLNSELPAGSTEKLVVFGPSMGGIIARYALAYMERNGLNHNTKLYASFDSPHNGSNISIGVQTFLTYMAYARNSASALQTVETELNNMTARQLLLSHHEAFVLTQNFGLFATPRGNILSSGVSPFRTTFVNNLNTIGFPTNLRKVAIASGAINGTKLINTVAGQEAAYMHIKCVQSAYGLLNGKSLAVANIHLAQGYGATDKIFRFAKKFQSSEPGFLGSVSTIRHIS